MQSLLHCFAHTVHYRACSQSSSLYSHQFGGRKLCNRVDFIRKCCYYRDSTFQGSNKTCMLSPSNRRRIWDQLLLECRYCSINCNAICMQCMIRSNLVSCTPDQPPSAQSSAPLPGYIILSLIKHYILSCIRYKHHRRQSGCSWKVTIDNYRSKLHNIPEDNLCRDHQYLLQHTQGSVGHSSQSCQRSTLERNFSMNYCLLLLNSQLGAKCMYLIHQD